MKNKENLLFEFLLYLFFCFTCFLKFYMSLSNWIGKCLRFDDLKSAM